MSGTCTKPDRDVPRLVCGHPIPCPHHTAVIEERAIDADLMRAMRWGKAEPKIHVVTAQTLVDGRPGLEVRAAAWAIVTDHGSDPGMRMEKTVWHGKRAFGLYVRIAELRDAVDELTREAHCALETFLFGDVQR